MAVVLVTGASGFIGSYVIKELVEKGYTVAGLDKEEPSEEIRKLCTRFYNCNIIDTSVIWENIFCNDNIDYIIHLASQVDVGYAQNYPCSDAYNNILSTLIMLQQAKNHRVKRFVFSSSASVYGKSYMPTEEDKVEPISNYGTSKVACEFYIQNSGVPYTIFRYANVYGYGNDKGIIPILFRCAITKEVFHLNGSEKKTRDFVSVEDIARYTVESLQYENFENEIVNISSNNEVSLKELIIIIQNIAGRIFIEVKDELEGDIKNSRLYNEKLIKLISENNQPFRLGNLHEKLVEMYEKTKLQYVAKTIK